MNFSAIHDVKREINRVKVGSTVNAEKLRQNFTKFRQIGYLVVISLMSLNAHYRSLLFANFRDILAWMQKYSVLQFALQQFYAHFSRFITKEQKSRLWCSKKRRQFFKRVVGMWEESDRLTTNTNHSENHRSKNGNSNERLWLQIAPCLYGRCRSERSLKHFSTSRSRLIKTVDKGLERIDFILVWRLNLPGMHYVLHQFTADHSKESYFSTKMPMHEHPSPVQTISSIV